MPIKKSVPLMGKLDAALIESCAETENFPEGPRAQPLLIEYREYIGTGINRNVPHSNRKVVSFYAEV